MNGLNWERIKWDISIITWRFVQYSPSKSILLTENRIFTDCSETPSKLNPRFPASTITPGSIGSHSVNLFLPLPSLLATAPARGLMTSSTEELPLSLPLRKCIEHSGFMVPRFFRAIESPPWSNREWLAISSPIRSPDYWLASMTHETAIITAGF